MVGYSVLFSRDLLTEDYTEMSLLSLKSFFWVNKEVPFFLFLLGKTDPLEEKLARGSFPFLRVIKIPDRDLPKGFWGMKTAPHGMRFSPIVRSYLPLGEVIGYFDLDILHVRPWEVPDSVEGKICISPDFALYLNYVSFYKETVSCYKNKRVTFCNTGVFYFKNIPGSSLAFLGEVWEGCLEAEREYPEGIKPWFDQHIFNTISEKHAHVINFLPIGHNFPLCYNMDDNPDTRATVTGSIRAMGESDCPDISRYHIFSTVREYRLRVMRLLACKFYRVNKILGEPPSRKLQVVVSEALNSNISFMEEALPAIRKALPDATVYYVTRAPFPSSDPHSGVIFIPWEEGNPRKQALPYIEKGVDTLFLPSTETVVGWSSSVHAEAMGLFDICNMMQPEGFEDRGAYPWGASLRLNPYVWVEGISPDLNNKVSVKGLLIKGTFLDFIRERVSNVFLPDSKDTPLEGILLGSYVGIVGGFAGFFPVDVHLEKVKKGEEYRGVKDPREGMLRETFLASQSLNSFWSKRDKLAAFEENLQKLFFGRTSREVLSRIVKRL